MEKPFESSDLRNPFLYPVTWVTSNKSWYLKKYQLCRKYFCIKPCMHSPSTKMGGKLKLRKAGLTLAMHLKLNFSSTVTRVTLEWLINACFVQWCIGKIVLIKGGCAHFTMCILHFQLIDLDLWNVFCEVSPWGNFLFTLQRQNKVCNPGDEAMM